MKKWISAAMLVPTLAFTAVDVKSCGKVEGNIVDTRTHDGKPEVAVKDLVDGEATWVRIDQTEVTKCQVGDQYPKCKSR